MGVPACLVKDGLPGEEGGDGGQSLQHSHPQLAFPANHEVNKTQVYPVLGIRILNRIRIRRIRMFLGLPDPDPLVRGMDPSLFS